MRSLGRWAMNSMAISFAALMRSGLKSRASILVETSIARTMSMPSTSTRSVSVEERGRARAITIITRATVRSRKGRWRSQAITDLPPLTQGVRVDTSRRGLRPDSSRYT